MRRIVITLFIFLAGSTVGVAQDEIDEYVTPTDVLREAVSGSALYINILVLLIGPVAIAALLSLRLPLLESLRQNMWDRITTALNERLRGPQAPMRDRLDRLTGGGETPYGTSLEALRRSLDVDADDDHNQ